MPRPIRQYPLHDAPIERIAPGNRDRSQEEVPNVTIRVAPGPLHESPGGGDSAGNGDEGPDSRNVELRPPREDGSHHSDAMRQRIGQWIIDHMSDTVEVCHPLLEAPRRRDPFKAEAF